MGHISKDTFKKLIILYLISTFKDALYSNYRLQKVLYFCEKKLSKKPFTFKHTEYGQYSYDAKEITESLEKLGFVKSSNLDSDEEGKKWEVDNIKNIADYENAINNISKKLKRDIDNCIKNYGYLTQEELSKRAHKDEELNNIKLGGTIVSENLPKYISVDLSDEDCEDLELSLNERFITTFRKLVNSIENKKIDPVFFIK